MRRLFLALLLGACSPAARGTHAAASGAASTATDDRARTSDFARAEDEALGWLAAADPRLAQRAGVTAPAGVLERIGTDAVLREDPAALIRGGSLDLFAFRARARALAHAAAVLSAAGGDLPENGPLGSPLARPRLERELLGRLIVEELARAEDESRMGAASGDLVRGIVATWTAPATPEEVPERDAWASARLLALRDSLRQPGARTGPLDVDEALYPLERLLAPLVFPKGAAAVAQLRMGLDDDTRPVPRLVDPARVARAVRVHLGLEVDPGALPARLEKLEAALHRAADEALAQAGEQGAAMALGRARELLLVERRCPSVADSPVRDMAPPPERAAACGVLRAMSEEPSRAAAVVALHDDVLLSLAAVDPDPPPRTRLLCHPDDDAVDGLRRAARERPVVALGAALAIEILYAAGPPDARLAAWRELGEAPLDVVAREVENAR